MTQVALHSTNGELAEALGQVTDGNPVLLALNGTPVAAVISVKDLRLLENHIRELEDRIDNEAADHALMEPGESIPYEEIRKEMGIA
jgi:prevent-host-death family protein